MLRPCSVRSVGERVITRDEVMELFGALADIKAAVLDILWYIESDDEDEEEEDE